MLKMGGYGFLRFALPITPDASREFDWLLIAPVADRRGVHRLRGAGADGHEEAHRLFIDRAHGLRDAGLVHRLRHLRRTPAPSQGAGMGIDGAMVQMVSHGLISGALFLCVGVMYDRVHSREISRLRRRDQHHAEVRGLLGVVRAGELRPAGHLGFRRRIPRDPRVLQGQLLVRRARRPHADPRRRLHAVAGEARDLRRQSPTITSPSCRISTPGSSSFSACWPSPCWPWACGPRR